MKGHIARLKKAREAERDENQTIREFIQTVLFDSREEGPFDVDSETHAKIVNALTMDFLFVHIALSLFYIFVVGLFLHVVFNFGVLILSVPYAICSYYLYQREVVWTSAKLRIKQD